jgi:hypothetical protein
MKLKYTKIKMGTINNMCSMPIFFARTGQ